MNLSYKNSSHVHTLFLLLLEIWKSFIWKEKFLISQRYDMDVQKKLEIIYQYSSKIFEFMQYWMFKICNLTIINDLFT